ncbi:MAG: HNH endonuclease [Methanobacteriaceae archaeon]
MLDYDSIQKEFEDYKREKLDEIDNLKLFEDIIFLKENNMELVNEKHKQRQFISEICHDDYLVKNEFGQRNKTVCIRTQRNSRGKVSVAHFLQILLYYVGLELNKESGVYIDKRKLGIFSQYTNKNYIRFKIRHKNKYITFDLNEKDNISTIFDLIDYINRKTIYHPLNCFVLQFSITFINSYLLESRYSHKNIKNYETEINEIKEDHKSEIDNKNLEIIRLNKKIDNLEKQKDELKYKISSGEIEVEVVEELKLKIDDLGEENSILNDKLKRKSFTKSIRHEVFKRDNYICVECGAKKSDDVTLHVDHIIPSSKGGNDELDNLQTLCQDCNTAKGDRTWKGGNEN